MEAICIFFTAIILILVATAIFAAQPIPLDLDIVKKNWGDGQRLLKRFPVQVKPSQSKLDFLLGGQLNQLQFAIRMALTFLKAI